MAIFSPALVTLLRETKAKMLGGREALLRGNIGEIAAMTREAEALSEQLVKLAPVQIGRNVEIVSLLTDIRRLGRGNTIIASEMLRHFRTGLATLRRLESHRSYGPNGGEQGTATVRSLGKA